LYVASVFNWKIVKVDSQGQQTEFVSDFLHVPEGPLGNLGPMGLVFDSLGALYGSTQGGTIVKVDAEGNQTVFAQLPYGHYPAWIAVDAGDNLYAGDYYWGLPVRMVTPEGVQSVFLSTPYVSGLAFTLSPQICVDPPAGLISWWPGDENANDIADGNDGTLMGGATFAPGKVEQAFLLDGIDDFVMVPDSPALAFGTKDFTVGFWVRFNTTTGEQVMVEKYVEGSPRTGWTLTKMDSNTLRLHLADDPSSSWNTLDVTPPPIPDNTWIFVAAKRQGNTFTIYWNGVPLGSASFPQTLDLTSPASLKFGHRGNPSDTPGSWDDRGFYLNGSMDEVSIYNRALTSEEIQALFNAGAAGMCKVATVSIDIKPGSFPNSINPRSKGVIPVAILTTSAFDATTVDPLSVKFGPDGATESHGRGHIEDVDGDGDQDLVLHFRTQDTGIQCGNTSASLTGETTNGIAIEGSDSISTVGCK
jgi:hypothetical protein